MYEVEHVLSANGVDIYQAWLDTVRDMRCKARITTRVDRASLGHFGDTEPVGDGVYEMKLNFGPGYRVYYAIQDRKVVFLLGGGSKDRQQNDIDQAKALWNSFKVKRK
ncbi:type II toxin-antitoxin system RelE/ParE family toxin [Pseudomonas sp. 21TX0197]|uniref:type II toxin-antitoxin system RelE/ParE family toxin n=1 Tax=unclassified Pseudomonas TaxID=196821 RepID=UPI000920DD59|nr:MULTISPECIES: type II toxin-antitoxin system RelE/ParE family toxin [unclassified Pseudomonas]MDB6445185.1 type II toxin-antitoxin system RelE/ParE family toxin [Pseudomonas sp. 21TX0197]SFX85992.1 putative addiction module killer protein [Pseudomonas sp. NFACC36]